MSRLQIQNYYKRLDMLIQYGGARDEQSIRGAFENLLNSYCEPKNFIIVPELYYQTKKNSSVRLDGIMKDALRLSWGYWEAKDEYDDLDKEIKDKFAKGYPNDNILFEDSQKAILIQNGSEAMRVDMRDPDKLDKILIQFINYERPEVKSFREAIEKFRENLPTVVETLRDTIASQDSKQFTLAFGKLFKICQDSINPKISQFDIREMIIQHILTEDIFLTVFNEAQFHRENVIAQELNAVVETFFTGKVRKNTLKSIASYYLVIRREAANIGNHHEKQKFLKVIYENFYKTYNPKGADRLGIVYTPNEIVQFMIRSTDFLLDKFFNRLLADKNVEILDPATGTGTFITELIEYLPENRLRDKYQHEIHCNEVAILPYYIANLNIEYTYQQKMGEYEAFSNICFVDTLDNVGFAHGAGYKNQQTGLALGLTEENAKRIESQNQRKISVIIGNPPYNANQQNENDNNPNRPYDEIDEMLKRTYFHNTTARKVKYDMYIRFFRWASTRLSENGILAFITNSSFINAHNLDGFRKVVAQEFNEIYIVDLGGNIRLVEKGNVFGIKLGVAISFMVKRQDSTSCKIYYARRPEMETNTDKLTFLSNAQFKDIDFERIIPDKNHNWLNIADNDFENLLPLANNETKLAKTQKNERTVFKLFSNGVSTNRDDWVYDFDELNLKEKINFFIEKYNNCSNNNFDSSIKWSATLKNRLKKGEKLDFLKKHIIHGVFRPFVKKIFYSEKIINDRLTQNHYDMFGKHFNKENILICFTDAASEKPFLTLVINKIPDLHLSSPGCGTQCLSFYRYDSKGNRIENITDWGLNQFQNHYQNQSITKLDIFHYTYAVLHNPAYREKYALNLKREFPRLPFYNNFNQWVLWGKQLMDLHLNYEQADKYPLKQIDIETSKENKPKLKADKQAGKIYLDSVSTLQGVPSAAWDYKLGNRSALEWILDQYKEKKPRDKTIAEKFNTYRFSDYKVQVIDLLQRVCTVSVETMKIINEMTTFNLSE